MTYAIIQCGWISPERYSSRDLAQAAADRCNAEAQEEADEEIVGDGAASVIEIEEG